MSLYQNTFYSKSLGELLSENHFIELMLRVESELAIAQASAKIIPKSSAEIISKCAKVQFIDIEKLKEDISLGGNAAIPLVKQLSVLVKSSDFEASKYVHFGATSQDIIDTATVLQIQEVGNWMQEQLSILEEELYKLTETHRDTVMIGRTLLQQAKPITFGLKSALWLRSIREDKTRISKAAENNRGIQMAGAVGSGNQRLNSDVLRTLCKSLNLDFSHSWQSSRGNLCEFAAALGILSGTLGKIAKDISLLMQTEIAEVLEGAAQGKGGSSTMPHKRNPVNCALIIANATRTPALVSTMLNTMPQEHERSAGLWHAEWETLESLSQLTGGSLEKTIELISNLEVNKEHMLNNLEITNGLIYAENVSLALAEKIGKIKAHEYVQKACKTSIAQNKHLLQILKEQKLELNNMEEHFKPINSLGFTYSIIDQILDK